MGVLIQLVGGVRRAGLGADHADARQGRHAQAPEIAGLKLRDLRGVGVREVQIAAEHRDVQILRAKHAAHMGGKPLGQRGVVKSHALDALGKGQMDTTKALLPGLAGTGFEGLFLLRQSCIYIVQTDAKLHNHLSLRRGLRHFVIILCKLKCSFLYILHFFLVK